MRDERERERKTAYAHKLTKRRRQMYNHIYFSIFLICTKIHYLIRVMFSVLNKAIIRNNIQLRLYAISGTPTSHSKIVSSHRFHLIYLDFIFESANRKKTLTHRMLNYVPVILQMRLNVHFLCAQCVCECAIMCFCWFWDWIYSVSLTHYYQFGIILKLIRKLNNIFSKYMPIVGFAVFFYSFSDFFWKKKGINMCLKYITYFIYILFSQKPYDFIRTITEWLNRELHVHGDGQLTWISMSIILI